MKPVDFLPADYRRRRRLRQARLWWGLVAGLFAIAVTAATIVQGGIYWAVQREYDALEREFALARDVDQKLAAVEERIARAREASDLYVCLGQPWPKTQLLAALAAPGDKAIQWRSLLVKEAALPTPATESTAAAAEDLAALPPAVADRKLLEAQERSNETVIEIAGAAKELEPLHAYVEALERSPFLAAAELRSLETQTADRGAKEFRFLIVVRVRPGYVEDAALLAETADASAAAPATEPTAGNDDAASTGAAAHTSPPAQPTGDAL